MNLVDAKGVLIVIPVHNNVHLALRLLKSIGHFRQIDDVRIVVVDDASQTDQQRLLERRLHVTSPGAQLIRSRSNEGFARSVNKGVEAARGDYIIVINSDCVVSPGFDLRAVTVLDRYRQIGAVTATTNSGNFTRICWTIPDGHNILSLSKQVREVGESAPRIMQILDGFYFACRRENFDVVGGLPTEYGRGYFEDVDFGFSLQHRGLQVAVDEQQFIFHQGSQSFPPAEKVELSEVNRRKLELKWGIDYAGLREEQFHDYPISYADEDFLYKRTQYPACLDLNRSHPNEAGARP